MDPKVPDQLAYFRQFHPISEKDWNLLKTSLTPQTFQKGDFLVVPGQVQRHLYLVKSGVQMSFFEANQKTNVLAFTYPPNFCAIPESFSLQTPSNCFLSCLTNSNMDAISFEELQQLFDLSPGLERLFRKMTEVVLAGVISRHLERLSLSMEQRFLAFCQRSPHLLQSVPHKYLASYLDIDPTNFSKLINRVKI